MLKLCKTPNFEALSLLVSVLSRLSGVDPKDFWYRYSPPGEDYSIAQVKKECIWLEVWFSEDGWWLIPCIGIPGCPSEDRDALLFSRNKDKLFDYGCLISSVSQLKNEGYDLW